MSYFFFVVLQCIFQLIKFPNFTSYGDFKYCTWLVGTRRRSDDETFSHLDDRYLDCGTRDVSTQETYIKVRQIMGLSAYLWIMYPNFSLSLTTLGRWFKDFCIYVVDTYIYNRLIFLHFIYENEKPAQNIKYSVCAFFIKCKKSGIRE